MSISTVKKVIKALKKLKTVSRFFYISDADKSDLPIDNYFYIW